MSRQEHFGHCQKSFSTLHAKWISTSVWSLIHLPYWGVADLSLDTQWCRDIGYETNHNTPSPHPELRLLNLSTVLLQHRPCWHVCVRTVAAMRTPPYLSTTSASCPKRGAERTRSRVDQRHRQEKIPRLRYFCLTAINPLSAHGMLGLSFLIDMYADPSIDSGSIAEHERGQEKTRARGAQSPPLLLRWFRHRRACVYIAFIRCT